MQKGSFPPAGMLKANQDEDIIQINNNTKTLVMAKEQYELSKGSENPMDSSKPKWQNLPLIRFILPKIAKNDNDA